MQNISVVKRDNLRRGEKVVTSIRRETVVVVRNTKSESDVRRDGIQVSRTIRIWEEANGSHFDVEVSEWSQDCSQITIIIKPTQEGMLSDPDAINQLMSDLRMLDFIQEVSRRS